MFTWASAISAWRDGGLGGVEVGLGLQHLGRRAVALLGQLGGGLLLQLARFQRGAGLVEAGLAGVDGEAAEHLALLDEACPAAPGAAATTPAVSERTTTVRVAWVRPRITTSYWRRISGISLAWTLGGPAARRRLGLRPCRLAAPNRLRDDEVERHHAQRRR